MGKRWSGSAQKGGEGPCKEKVAMSEVGNKRGDGAVQGKGGGRRGWHCDGKASHIFKIKHFIYCTRNKVRRNTTLETRNKIEISTSC